MAKHDELVEAGFFDSKFKNTLRDYYTYGFKTYSDLQREGENGKQIPSTYTIDNDWKRLSNILYGYFEWKSKSDTAFFLSNDSQSLSENPFHKIPLNRRQQTHSADILLQFIVLMIPRFSSTVNQNRKNHQNHKKCRKVSPILTKRKFFRWAVRRDRSFFL